MKKYVVLAVMNIGLIGCVTVGKIQNDCKANTVNADTFIKCTINETVSNPMFGLSNWQAPSTLDTYDLL